MERRENSICRFLKQISQDTLLALGTEHALVVDGADGLDEITTSGLTNVAELCEGAPLIGVSIPTSAQPAEAASICKSNCQSARSI